jgi:hypothetical protein
MNVWSWRALATVSGLVLLAGCGAGSGRSGTDLAVSGSVAAETLNGGDAVSFEMTVLNRGDFEAKDVLIRNATLQVSQASVHIACAAAGGATCPATTGTSMTVDRLPAGGSLSFTVTGTLNAGASGTFANTTSVSADTADVNTDNNSLTVSGTARSNDVGVTGVAPAGPLLTDVATFSFNIDNPGPDAASDVVLTTTAVSNLALLRSQISCLPTGAASLPVLQPDDTLLVASLPAGASLACSVPVTVAAGTNGSIAVSMSVAAAGDGRAGNNTATAVVGATLVSNLGLSGSAADTQVNGGAATRFDFVISNQGPASALDVALTNTLSPDLSLAGAVNCTSTGGAVLPTPTADGGLVSAAIPAAAALNCSVPVTVAAGANGVVFDTFVARSANPARAEAVSLTLTTVAVSSNLGASMTGPGEVAAGTALSFSARVNNPGPGQASNVVIDWTTVAPAGVTFQAPTCVGRNGAVCPAVLGASMTVPNLGPGRTLDFTFGATTQTSARGAVESRVVVRSDEDQDLGNNTASASATLVDPRSGSYEVFAADGHGYTLNIDFDALAYTMSGNGASVARQFVAEGDGFTVGGAAKLRLATDLIVGGHDFGAGVLPFVAARNFASNVATLAGTYNLFSRRVAADGSATTLPGTAFISGNTLSICESEMVAVASVRLCAAENRTDFVNLSASGSVITGSSASGERFSFSVASSGAAKILLAAGTMPDQRQRLRIGLVDSTGGVTFGPAQQGPTSKGDWANVTLVDGLPVLWTSTGGFSTDSAQLVGVTNSGSAPFSMLTGTSVATNDSIFLMQAYPMIVVIGGSPFVSAASSGLLQIALP